MFDRFFDLLVEIWDSIRPWEILKPYQRGVHLRCGKFLRTVGPGVVGKRPLVDEILTDNVVPTTTPLHEQTLTTKDNHTVVVRGIVTWRINNIKRALLDVEDVDGVLTDVVNGVITEETIRGNWDYVRSRAFSTVVTQKARLEAWKFGLDIIEVNFMDVVKLRAYRLIGER